MKNVFLVTLVLAFSIISCNNSQSQDEKIPEDSIQKPGSDRDAHGCIPSAGYTWSELKQECVRVFSAGTPFDAYGSNKDSSLAAFVIVGKDKSKVEVFLPNYLAKSVILDAVKPTVKGTAPVLYENQQEQVKIIKLKDMFLIDVKNEPVFSQKYSTSEGLGKELK